MTDRKALLILRVTYFCQAQTTHNGVVKIPWRVTLIEGHETMQMAIVERDKLAARMRGEQIPDGLETASQAAFSGPLLTSMSKNLREAGGSIQLRIVKKTLHFHEITEVLEEAETVI